MNCKCITDIEKKLVGMDHKNRKILKAKFLSMGFLLTHNSMISVTSSEIELEVEGMKKKPIQNIFHSWCPFCGTKISKDD
ncbi:MAG: hypothetical protein ABI921_00590 [Panacibacter sp.]